MILEWVPFPSLGDLPGPGMNMGLLDFPGSSESKESACNVGPGSIPWLRRPLGGGHGNAPQYSCLENPMGRGLGGLQSTGLERVKHN